MKIGLTFRDDQHINQTWYGSGIGQNIKFYYDLLEVMGYQPFMLVNKKFGISAFGKDYKVIEYAELLNSEIERADIIIEVGATVPENCKSVFKSKFNTKFIVLRCGHPYTGVAERLFVSGNLSKNLFKAGQDAIWVLPHYKKTMQFLSVIHSCPSYCVPYIWEPDFVEKQFKQSKREEKPNIFVMEPNISSAKTALIPMAIIEKLYRLEPEKFDKAVIFNSERFANRENFLYNFVDNMPSLQARNGKVFFNKRDTINNIFVKPDILLTHQVDNELNYLTNEALNMGIPVVHNSPPYKDFGYYYPDMNVDDGVEQILNVIANHDPVKDIEKNEGFLKGFSIYNKNVQNEYAKLLTLVVNG
jgi:uncharacterized Fe-S cluster protein YjdI